MSDSVKQKRPIHCPLFYGVFYFIWRELVTDDFCYLSVIVYHYDCPFILQELGESTLVHPIRATTDKILLLDICTPLKYTFLTHCDTCQSPY